MARAIDADRLADGLKLHRQPTDQKHEADRHWTKEGEHDHQGSGTQKL